MQATSPTVALAACAALPLLCRLRTAASTRRTLDTSFRTVRRTEALYVRGQAPCLESSAQVDLGITVDIRSVAILAVHDRDEARTFFEPRRPLPGTPRPH